MKLFAVKGNREERIDEGEKELFLEQGFDIYEKKEGKFVKTDSASGDKAEEVKQLKAENKKLKDLLKKIKAGYEIKELEGVEL